MGQRWRLFERLFRGALPIFRRHLRRALSIRDKIRVNEETLHLAAAGVVGVMGGLTNYFFYAAIDLVMRFALHGTGEVVAIAQVMSGWERAIIPALGGLAAGLVLYWGLRLVGNQGASNILEVVVSGNGRLPMRTAIVKGISSLLSIGTGASIGREGSITQLTATFASKLGVVAKWPPYRLRLMVACGAASGMAAAYNAPVAGSIFAAYIVLGNFSMHLFAPIVFAAVIATLVSRYFLGVAVFYQVPQFDFTFLSQLPWFIVLGVVSGALAAAFLKALQLGESYFGKMKIPIYARLALAGAIVGAMAVWHPAVWGNGYGAITQILQKPVDPLSLSGLFAAKFVAIVVTVGAGAVGGVFTPTLFLGAALGALFGAGLNALDLTTLPNGAFALVGMGSVLAGTIHAPLLAIIMIFEISLNYSIMPPLMLACVVATLVARGMHGASIYTEPLRRKGITAHPELDRYGEATETHIGEIMREPVPPVPATASFQVLADRFLTSTYNFIPVVNEMQRLIGVVALHDLKEFLHSGHEMSGIIAYDIMRPPPSALTPGEKLVDAFPVLLQSELRNVPVVNNRVEGRLIGSVLRSEALQLLSEAAAAKRVV